MSPTQKISSNQPNTQEEFYGQPVFQYTSDQAVVDGILFDLTQLNPAWKKGLFNYVTVNLLNRGYMYQDKISIPNLLDLLNQANQIVRRETKGFMVLDSFFDGSVELPDGDKQKIFIVWNETGKFTIMLPEDY